MRDLAHILICDSLAASSLGSSFRGPIGDLILSIPPRFACCMPAHLLDMNLSLNLLLEPVSTGFFKRPADPPQMTFDLACRCFTWDDSRPIPVVFRNLNGKLLGWYPNFMAIGEVPCTEILEDVSREVSEAFTCTADVHNNPSNWPSSSNPRMLEQRKISCSGDHFTPMTFMKGSGHQSLGSDIKENAHLFQHQTDILFTRDSFQVRLVVVIPRVGSSTETRLLTTD